MNSARLALRRSGNRCVGILWFRYQIPNKSAIYRHFTQAGASARFPAARPGDSRWEGV